MATETTDAVRSGIVAKGQFFSWRAGLTLDPSASIAADKASDTSDLQEDFDLPQFPGWPIRGRARCGYVRELPTERTRLRGSAPRATGGVTIAHDQVSRTHQRRIRPPIM